MIYVQIAPTGRSVRKLDKKSSEMNYLEWSRVIDELENVLRGSKLTQTINEAFLKVALEEREKHPKPKVVNSMTG